MKIDRITFPKIVGVPAADAFRNLDQWVRDTTQLVVSLNNDLQKLQAKVVELEARLATRK